MDLLNLASRHRNWLALRHNAVAENIANANTPGFKARQVQPFTEVLNNVSSEASMTGSHPRHHASVTIGSSIKSEESDEAGVVTHSGNSVNVEEELLTAGAVKREYALNTSVSRAFRRMIAAAVRG
jgi:flagellar basal-body rod protein FlgB